MDIETNASLPPLPDVANPQKPKAPKKIIFLGAGLIVAIVAGAYYFSTRQNQAPPLYTVKAQDLKEIIEVSGIVESKQDITLKSNQAGTVLQRLVEENSQVTESQALLRLDPGPLNLQLQQAQINAEAAIQSAQSEVNNALKTLNETQKSKQLNLENLRSQVDKFSSQVHFLQSELVRNQQLLQQGAVIKQSVDNLAQQLKQAQIDLRLARENISRAQRNQTEQTQAQTRLQQARTALANAQKQGPANVAIIRDNLNRSLLSAPFSGTLTRWQVNKGDYVTPGTPLARLVNLNFLRLKLNLNELDLPKISARNPIQIVFDAYPEENYAGHLTWMSKVSVIDKENVQVFPVEVAFKNQNNRIKPGMSADAEITVQERKQVLAIPIGAVRKNGKIYEVERWNGKSKETVPVTPGISTQELLEITKGLQAGDQIVIEAVTEPNAAKK